MSIHDYLCKDCGNTMEILVLKTDQATLCESCGSSNLKKFLSAHSSLSGTPKNRMPGLGDTSCCGTSSAEAGCAGPGSCCGKNF